MKCEILKHDVESFAFRIICCASQSEKREREQQQRTFDLCLIQ